MRREIRIFIGEKTIFSAPLRCQLSGFFTVEKITFNYL